jgi:hypothetical protein
MELAQEWERGESRVDHPAYMPSLIARYLRLPVSSVRWWTLGNGSHLPVIRIASPED